MGELCEAVVSGTYAEGAWLPNVSELHEQFGCSKGVVREALRGLEERGLVEVQQGQGARVRQREAWDTRNPHVLRACAERGPEPDTLRLAIEARAAVECVAAEAAVETAADGDLWLLAERVEAMERATSSQEFVSAEAWFHRTLLLLSGNELLAKLVEPWHAVLAEIRRDRAPERDGATIRHHRRILEGVSSREPELATEAILTYGERLAGWV